MRTATLPSFRRCLRGLSDVRLLAVLEAIRAADAAYGNPHRHSGIGLRVIGDFMECRDALDMRLIFQRNADTLEFHFYGTHSEVKAFLRNRR
jgi:mRNA-degrading endonuclease YafQ of YafQ-DinJ toxin-antitoxin module